MATTSRMDPTAARGMAMYRWAGNDPIDFAGPSLARVDAKWSHGRPYNELADIVERESVFRRVRVKNTSGGAWTAPVPLYLAASSKLTAQTSGSASNNQDKGTSRQFLVSVTFEVGQLVKIDSGGGIVDYAFVTAAVTTTSVTVDRTHHDHTTPTITALPAYEATEADADGAKAATWITVDDIADGAYGWAYAEIIAEGLDTSSWAAEALLYLSATAGALTTTAPTGADQNVQVVGVVRVSDASNGVVHFFPGARIITRFASSMLGSFTAEAIPFGQSGGGALTEAPSEIGYDTGGDTLVVGASPDNKQALGRLELQFNGGACASNMFAWSSVGAQGCSHAAYRARGTRGSESAVQNGDALMSWLVSGYGTNFGTSGVLLALADGTHSGGSTPGKFRMATTPSGSASSVTRTTWRADGKLLHAGEVQIGTVATDLENDENVGGKINTGGTPPSAYDAAADAHGRSLNIRAQDGGAHTSNNPTGGDVFLIPGAAGSGGAGVAGHVKFGTHAALSGETVTGYITIKDAGGTLRKLAVVS